MQQTFGFLVLYKCEQETKEIFQMVEENVSSLDTQIKNLQNVELKSGVVTTEKAVEAAQTRKEKLKDFIKEERDQLQLRIDQANMMNREMRRNEPLEIDKED